MSNEQTIEHTILDLIQEVNTFDGYYPPIINDSIPGYIVIASVAYQDRPELEILTWRKAKKIYKRALAWKTRYAKDEDSHMTMHDFWIEAESEISRKELEKATAGKIGICYWCWQEEQRCKDIFNEYIRTCFKCDKCNRREACHWASNHPYLIR